MEDSVKLLVIGCGGQLGKDMMLAAKAQNFTVEGMDFPAIDITDSKSVRSAVMRVNPDVIINCAAHTAVDACEKEAEKAYAINGAGVANIALAAKQAGAKLVHLS